MSEDHLLNLIFDPSWDAPFFKRLAANDTGNAPGHQGGFVIPKPLRPYFPSLNEGETTPGSPTVEEPLVAELFDSGRFLASCETIYRFQTWGATRTSEGRITANLGPLRNLAHGGDLLVMQRSRDNTRAYRFFLIQRASEHYGAFEALVSGRRWGALDPQNEPLSRDELLAATEEMKEEATAEFEPIRHDIPRSPISRDAIARSTAFREIILEEYGRRCCVSGIALATRTLVEAEAAHVVGLGFGGADEPRNGMLLTGTLHWAFDQGMFGIDENRKVIIPESIQDMPQNTWLIQFQGRALSEANTPILRTSPLAFAWHREHILAKSDD